MSLSPGNSEVIATKVSDFDTFLLNSETRPKQAMSDHSGKYYAAYCKAKGALQIWDIETGEMVRRIPNAEFPKIVGVTSVLVVAKQGPNGPQQVVVTGIDVANDHPFWSEAPSEWDYGTDFKVFPIEAGSPEWTGRIVKPDRQLDSCWFPLDSFHLVSSLKVPRCPVGITSLDAPDAPGYLSEEIDLALWYWDPEDGNVHSSYRSVIPDRPPTSAPDAPDAPLAIECEFRATFRRDPCCSPFNAGFRSGVSLTLETTGKKNYDRRRLLPYQLCVRGFRPSDTPGVMDLDWETRLKSSQDKRQTREILSVKREDMHTGKSPEFPIMTVIDEGEFATAFLDLGPGVAELVLVLWDDWFHGELPLWGKVLN